MSHVLPKNASAADSSVTAPPPAQLLLQKLLKSSIVLAEDLEALSHSQRNSLTEQDDKESLLATLTELKLITDYQAGRIDAGTLFGLVLGNYRILNRLGAGGMGVVFKAEHIQMRKQVAIKVLPANDELDPRIFCGFPAPKSACDPLPRLNHPNIVGAIEMGQETSHDGDRAPLFRDGMACPGPGHGGINQYERPYGSSACMRPYSSNRIQLYPRSQ